MGIQGKENTFLQRTRQSGGCGVVCGSALFGSLPGLPCGSAGKESACNVGDLGWEDPLEKGKAPHSSILAWRIPWTVKSRGSQRVGHDRLTFTSLHFRTRGVSSSCPTPL